jgi:hypothetical protein
MKVKAQKINIKDMKKIKAGDGAAPSPETCLLNWSLGGSYSEYQECMARAKSSK